MTDLWTDEEGASTAEYAIVTMAMVNRLRHIWQSRTYRSAGERRDGSALHGCATEQSRWFSHPSVGPEVSKARPLRSAAKIP